MLLRHMTQVKLDVLHDMVAYREWFAYSNMQETKYFIFAVYTYHCGFQHLSCYLQPLLYVYQLMDGHASLSQKNLNTSNQIYIIIVL